MWLALAISNGLKALTRLFKRKRQVRFFVPEGGGPTDTYSLLTGRENRDA